MSTWNKLDNSLEEKTLNINNINIRLVKPNDSVTYSLSCPICDNIIGSLDDMHIMRQENCCEECYLLYYYSNKEKWNNGWRPNIKE